MIWVVVAARVPEDNVLALTLEKIRAGVVPISADRIIGRDHRGPESTGST